MNTVASDRPSRTASNVPLQHPAERTAFFWVAVTSGAICFGLAAVWLAAPQFMFALWRLNFAPESGFVGRRMGALFLGIGSAFVVARRAPASPLRSALLRSAAAGCGLLALLGSSEFLAHRAGPGILAAVVVELVMTLALVVASRTT